MQCYNCGTEVNDGDAFCKKCGKAVFHEPAPAGAVVISPAPAKDPKPKKQKAEKFRRPIRLHWLILIAVLMMISDLALSFEPIVSYDENLYGKDYRINDLRIRMDKQIVLDINNSGNNEISYFIGKNQYVFFRLLVVRKEHVSDFTTYELLRAAMPNNYFSERPSEFTSEGNDYWCVAPRITGLKPTPHYCRFRIYENGEKIYVLSFDCKEKYKKRYSEKFSNWLNSVEFIDSE